MAQELVGIFKLIQWHLKMVSWLFFNKPIRWLSFNIFKICPWENVKISETHIFTSNCKIMLKKHHIHCHYLAVHKQIKFRFFFNEMLLNHLDFKLLLILENFIDQTLGKLIFLNFCIIDEFMNLIAESSSNLSSQTLF